MTGNDEDDESKPSVVPSRLPSSHSLGVPSIQPSISSHTDEPSISTIPTSTPSILPSSSPSSRLPGDSNGLPSFLPSIYPTSNNCYSQTDAASCLSNGISTETSGSCSDKLDCDTLKDIYGWSVTFQASSYIPDYDTTMFTYKILNSGGTGGNQYQPTNISHITFGWATDVCVDSIDKFPVGYVPTSPIDEDLCLDNVLRVNKGLSSGFEVYYSITFKGHLQANGNLTVWLNGDKHCGYDVIGPGDCDTDNNNDDPSQPSSLPSAQPSTARTQEPSVSANNNNDDDDDNNVGSPPGPPPSSRPSSHPSLSPSRYPTKIPTPMPVPSGRPPRPTPSTSQPTLTGNDEDDESKPSLFPSLIVESSHSPSSSPSSIIDRRPSASPTFTLIPSADPASIVSSTAQPSMNDYNENDVKPSLSPIFVPSQSPTSASVPSFRPPRPAPVTSQPTFQVNDEDNESSPSDQPTFTPSAMPVASHQMSLSYSYWLNFYENLSPNESFDDGSLSQSNIFKDFDSEPKKKSNLSRHRIDAGFDF